MKYIVTILAVCCLMAACNNNSKETTTTESNAAVNDETPATGASPAFTQNYFGQLNNNNNVYVQLSVKNNQVNGIYFYESQGIDIPLQGTMQGDSVVLFETDTAGTRTARISGTLSNNSFAGQWERLQDGKTYPLNFKATHKNIKPLPVIAGTYRNSAKTVCKLTIIITRSNTGYDYRFQSPTRNLAGKVMISRGLNEGENYIMFQGIKWAEPGETAKTNPAAASGLDGQLNDSEILIQNAGNAMNYFTKLAECEDDKYITLKKEY